MPGVEAYAVATLTASVVFGGAVTASAVRAYRRTNGREMAALAAGLGLVTAGVAVGGTLSLAAPGVVAVASGGTLTAAGFLAVAYSLHTQSAAGVARGPRGGPGERRRKG